MVTRATRDKKAIARVINELADSPRRVGGSPRRAGESPESALSSPGGVVALAGEIDARDEKNPATVSSRGIFNYNQ
jgi:hypothetical protein